MMEQVRDRAADRRQLGCRRHGLAQLGATGSVIAVLVAGACAGETAGGPSGVGGSSGEAGAPPGSGGTSNGVGGSGASGGVGGTDATTAGAAGAGGSDEVDAECRPDAAAPIDTCEYPESLGGTGDPTQCGVTPGDWYPLGDSEMTTWPERWAVLAAADGNMRPRVALDSEDRPVVGWVREGLEVRRWTDSGWEALPAGELARTDTNSFDLVLDGDGDPLLLEQYGDTMRVLRWGDAGWVSLGDWAGDGTGSIALDAEDHPVIVYSHDHRVFAKRWNGSNFDELLGSGTDGSLDLQAVDTTPALALRQNGNVVAVWTEQLDSETQAVWLQEFDGDHWEGLGDSASSAGVASGTEIDTYWSASVAVDENDQVVVAWHEKQDEWYESGYVRVWDGEAWSHPDHTLSLPQLRQGVDGVLHLTGTNYDDFDGEFGDSLHLKRWELGSWVSGPDLNVDREGMLALGRNEHFAMTSDKYPDHVSVSLNTDGTWVDLDSPTAQGAGVRTGLSQHPVGTDDGWFLHDSSCAVAHWDGAAWRNITPHAWRASCGRSILTEAPTGELVLALWFREYGPNGGWDDEGFPEHRSNYTLRVLGWTGDEWEPLTDAFEFVDAVDDVSISFDATGAPFVAWASSEPVFAHDGSVITWDGTDWVELPEPESWEPEEVELTALPDGRLIVWHDDLRDEAEHTALYEAGEWHPLPDLERSDETPLSVVHDANGTPFMAWPTETSLALYELAGSRWRAVAADEARLTTLPESIRTHVFSKDGEVYLRRFEDCSWQGVSASDRGGGVSNSAEASEYPALATFDGTTCVSWEERAGKYPMQFVRCHD